MTRGRWRVACAVAICVQLIVLYAPRAPSTGGIPGVDKVIHAGVFAAVAVTACAAGAPWRLVLAMLLAHAVVSEVLQATVLAHRDGEPLDAVADSVGAVLGASCAWVVTALAAVAGRRMPREPMWRRS